jgi:hypothetical protein
MTPFSSVCCSILKMLMALMGQGSQHLMQGPVSPASSLLDMSGLGSD